MIFKIPKKLGEQEGRHLETLNYFLVFNKVNALQFNNLKGEKVNRKQEVLANMLFHHCQKQGDDITD